MTTEQEIYELKKFIWLNVFGWIKWREEEFPHRDGYSLGDEYGEKCLEADMIDPLSTEGAMEVLKKCSEKYIISIVKTPAGNFGIDAARGAIREELEEWTMADTLELAICQFAKKLFSTPMSNHIEIDGVAAR